MAHFIQGLPLTECKGIKTGHSCQQEAKKEAHGSRSSPSLWGSSDSGLGKIQGPDPEIGTSKEWTEPGVAILWRSREVGSIHIFILLLSL